MDETVAAESAVRRRQHDGDSLLAIAVDVFNDRGYDGTSMEHIASAAGITKSSIYHHIPGKEAMLGLAMDRAIGALSGALEPVEQASYDRPLDAVEAIVRRTAHALIAELPFVTLFLRVRGNSPTERRALLARRDFDRRVSVLVERSSAAGELREGVDAELVTKLIFGMVNSLIEWYRPKARTSAAVIVDQLTALVLSGLKPR